ncbi:MAG: SDR family oxidoreductase [Piscirickettsiaceae bacterium]|nr:SDR family oxidoreductase [Piscirickettsiaceae bacterium]
MKILLTGSTGFVGKALTTELLRQEKNIVASVRRHSNELSSKIKQVITGELSPTINWHDALNNVDVVIHLAARVHVMNDESSDPLTEFRRVNTEATLDLARQAAEVGVKRFIFISSIKVNGEMTGAEKIFMANDNFIPTDPYGLSKYEAEQGLLALVKKTGMEVVIIRPPLVYGVGVKANFASMIKWVKKGVPLPFGAIQNQRSLIALDNLVSFIIHCIDHPKAANEVFLISDDEDVSTTELLQKVAKALGKKAVLLPIPVSLMHFVAKLAGKSELAIRLFGSLQVDSSKARDLLGWKPVITMEEQLKKMVKSG